MHEIHLFGNVTVSTSCQSVLNIELVSNSAVLLPMNECRTWQLELVILQRNLIRLTCLTCEFG